MEKKMKNMNNFSNQTRREFLKGVTIAGSTVYLGIGGIFALPKSYKVKPYSNPEFEYKFRTVSVEHIKELKRWFEKLEKEKRLSINKIFRDFIGRFQFNPDEILPGAKSIVIISVYLKNGSIIFNHKGKKIEIFVPSGYFNPGLTLDTIKPWILDDITKNPDTKYEPRTNLPIKTLAVRSGLADYGKNNIAYIDGFGSFHRMVCAYTDQELEDNWRPLNMLHLCKGCSICIKECPTKCITDNNFMINIDKCIPLYNEKPAALPEWIPSDVHHTMIGCLKCQYTCPANEARIKDIEILAEITEEETEFLLSEKSDQIIHNRLIEKLKMFRTARNLDHFRRNFKLAFANIFPKS